MENPDDRLKISESELKDIAQALDKGTNSPKAGQIYRHYKGGLYVIVCRSIHEETLEPLVTYQSNAKGTIWTRTLQKFTEEIQGGPRFRRMEDDDVGTRVEYTQA